MRGCADLAHVPALRCPPSGLPAISPSGGEITLSPRPSPIVTMAGNALRRSCQSPHLRGRWPAGQRGREGSRPSSLVYFSTAMLTFALGHCQRTLLSGRKIRGAGPCCRMLSNGANPRSTGDFCLRPFRFSKHRHFRPCPTSASSSAPARRGTLGRNLPGATGYVSPLPEAPAPPRMSPSRPAFPREELRGYGRFGGGDKWGGAGRTIADRWWQGRPPTASSRASADYFCKR